MKKKHNSFLDRFSLIGIQEIACQESLEMLIQELNNPTIPSIKDWPNRPRGKWNYTLSDAVRSTSQVTFSNEVWYSFWIF